MYFNHGPLIRVATMGEFRRVEIEYDKCVVEDLRVAKVQFVMVTLNQVPFCDSDALMLQGVVLQADEVCAEGIHAVLSNYKTVPIINGRHLSLDLKRECHERYGALKPKLVFLRKSQKENVRSRHVSGR